MLESTWPTTTTISAIKNIEEPITFAWAGIPRAAAVYTNFGKVVTVPELKLVIIKSSKESEKERSAAAAIPGATNGRVTLLNVCHSFAYRSIAACSRRGSRDAIRALTVTTTNEIQNITCAIMVGTNPGVIPRFKNIVRRDAPNTISGVAIGKKISKLVVDRPANLYLPNAKAIRVPSMVAKIVEIKPIFNELPSAIQMSGAPHGFFQFFNVNPFHTKLLRPESLKEKANV